MGGQVRQTGIDVGVADVYLGHACRRRVPTLQDRFHDGAVESHSAEEVLFRVGGRHWHDVPLKFEHHGRQTVTGSAAPVPRQLPPPTAAWRGWPRPTPAW